MRQVSEITAMAIDNGVTISDNIERMVDPKAVTKRMETVDTEGKVVVSYQKKKGKPTKKITAFATAYPGHIESLIYCIPTSDVDLREIFRQVKQLDNMAYNYD